MAPLKQVIRLLLVSLRLRFHIRKGVVPLKRVDAKVGEDHLRALPHP